VTNKFSSNRVEIFKKRGGHMLNDSPSSVPFIKGRGENYCRGCHGVELFSALDLGTLPIANELLVTQGSHIEEFPLHLRVCTQCKLGQVADVVTPERIFRDYRYLSSMSSTFLKHAFDFVNDRVNEKMFSPNDWVLEIASNDGYLLKNFLPFGIKAIGVEPAENVAKISKSLGIQTISEFFSSVSARELLAEHGYPKLIIANNVMAHVPDLTDFVKGLAILCGPETQISIENPSLANILVEMQFDTIYHEHYSYLSATAVAIISEMNGLRLTKVEELSIHGGSNRYWLTKLESERVIDSSVGRVSNSEIQSGLFDSNIWSNYSSKVTSILEEFHLWLRTAREDNRKIYGYGAAAKASTILNAIDLDPNLLLAIADLSLEKQKRFMPPHGTKIISPQELFASNPTDIVIFPWNIKSEIAIFLRTNLANEVRLWCAIPNMHEITA
jgi:hypothetical protein